MINPQPAYDPSLYLNPTIPRALQVKDESYRNRQYGAYKGLSAHCVPLQLAWNDGLVDIDEGDAQCQMNWLLNAGELATQCLDSGAWGAFSESIANP
jgi:hypothetical protein